MLLHLRARVWRNVKKEDFFGVSVGHYFRFSYKNMSYDCRHREKWVKCERDGIGNELGYSDKI
jgi:hypothetical protein